MMIEDTVKEVNTSTKPIIYLLYIITAFYCADVAYSYLTIGRATADTGGFFNPTEIIRGIGTLLLIAYFFNASITPEKRFIFYIAVYYTLSYILTTIFYGIFEYYTATQFRYMSVLLKYYFSLLLPFFIFMYCTKTDLDERNLFNYTRYFLFFAYVVPIYLSWMDIAGFKAYMFNYEDISSGRFGYKGFFYSHNALAAIVVMVTMMFMTFERKRDTIFLFFSFGGGFLTGTKGYILITAFCTVLYLAVKFIGSIKKQNKLETTSIMFLFLFIMSVTVFYFFFALTKTYEYTYNASSGFQSYDSLLWVLTSGRSGYQDIFWDALPTLDMMQILFGGMQLSIGEMDTFSTLDSFGLLGLIIYFFLVYYLFRITLKIYQRSAMHLAVSLGIIGLICHSIVGGHVYGVPPTMTAASPVIALFLYLNRNIRITNHSEIH